MRFDLIIFFSGMIILLIFLLFRRTPTKYTNVKIGNIVIKAEIADTHLKRIIGLMSKKSLPEDQGMLFVFNQDGFHSIWMMNMSFPIDIIWIDNEKKVVDVVKNARPCRLSCTTYKPKEKARYVLEVNANFTEKNGIKIGAELDFKIN